MRVTLEAQSSRVSPAVGTVPSARPSHARSRWGLRVSSRIAARRGVATLVDPRLDAREASPVWVIGAPPPVTVVRDEVRPAHMHATAAERFSLWRLAGRKMLLDDGSGLRLVVRLLPQEVQLRLGERLTAEDRFAYQIPATGDHRAAWAVLNKLRGLIPPSPSGQESLCGRPRPRRSLTRPIAAGARWAGCRSVPARARGRALRRCRRRPQMAAGRRPPCPSAISHPPGTGADGRRIPLHDRRRSRPPFAPAGRLGRGSRAASHER